MNIKQAKAFIEYLHYNGLFYDFDYCAVDSLYWTNACSLEQAMEIEVTMDEIKSSSLDWGEFKSPFGYAIELIRRDREE